MPCSKQAVPNPIHSMTNNILRLTGLKLPYGQDELIQQIVAANPRTIVVLKAPWWK